MIKDNDDLIQECFVDFLSNDWVYEKFYDNFIKKTGYTFTSNVVYRTGGINKVNYAGRVKEEKINVVGKYFKGGGGNDCIKQSDFISFVDDLNTAVLRFNQMTGKNITFVFNSYETASFVSLVIDIYIYPKTESD